MHTMLHSLIKLSICRCKIRIKPPKGTEATLSWIALEFALIQLANKITSNGEKLAVWHGHLGPKNL